MQRSLLIVVVTLAASTAHAKRAPAPGPVPKYWIGTFEPSNADDDAVQYGVVRFAGDDVPPTNVVLLNPLDPDRFAHSTDSIETSRPEQVYAASYVRPGELSAWPPVLAIAVSDAPSPRYVHPSKALRRALIKAYRTQYDRAPLRREPVYVGAIDLDRDGVPDVAMLGTCVGKDVSLEACAMHATAIFERDGSGWKPSARTSSTDLCQTPGRISGVR